MHHMTSSSIVCGVWSACFARPEVFWEVSDNQLVANQTHFQDAGNVFTLSVYMTYNLLLNGCRRHAHMDYT